MAASRRLIFAHQLRGIAALCVVAAHLVGAFWADRDGFGRATATPALAGAAPDWVVSVTPPWFSPGAFGVATFFLISGLVIPVSLGRHSAVSFLLARALRIYPTLALALVLEIAVIHANAGHWDLPMPFGRWFELTNVLLVHDIFGTPSIDLVNWTLLAEVKFYLLTVCLAGTIQRGRVRPLLIAAVLITLGNVAFGQGSFVAERDAPLRMASLESVLVQFMLIGVLFNYHLRGLLSLGGLLLNGAAMAVLFTIAWRFSETRANFPGITLHYLLALAVFAAAYGLRHQARRIAVLDWLADISFPLYLIHLVIGLSVMKWLMLETGLPYAAALLLSLAVCLGLATLLHRGIEKPSTGWGSRLAVVPA